MDPDEALKLAREEADRFNQMYERDDGDDDALVELGSHLAEHFIALDGWMTNGGYMPGQWKPNHTLGRPRRLIDGVVLEKVSHGTRSAYNQGCRCIRCTAANRAGGATYRAKKKGKTNANV